MVITRETEVRLDGWCEGGSGQQRERGRPRLGWMDGVVAVGNGTMTVEAARQYATDLKEWRVLVHM